MRNNIGLFMTKRAELNPRVEALVDTASGDRYTYEELNARCNRVANALVHENVAPGDRVATLLMNGSAFVECFFGAAKIGAVVVALNWRLVADELAFILSDSGAETLVFGSEFVDVVEALHARGTDGSHVTRWVHVGDPAERPSFAVGYEDLSSPEGSAEPEVVAADDDLLFILYTSGTTGLPKGVMHSHNTTLWSVITICATADLRYRDRYLISLPLFHVGALTPLLACIYKGGTSVIMREFHPVRIWELFGEERVTTTLAVPAMLNFMLSTYDAEAHDISRLRWVMSGASPVPVTLIEAYAELDVEIHQVYGLTESGGPACLISPDEALDHAGSTGKAFFHTEVTVVNDAGEPVAPGEPGEVLVRGPHVMVGYWNRPDETAETVVDGWVHTGDVAMLDKDGYMTIHDRVKDMIISGGENVYPAEIENVILGHPGVADVAVIGTPSDRWGESPLAIVVPADDSLTEDQVLDWCDGKLARFKQPTGARFTDEIPRNPTGKVLKRVLRDEYVPAS